MSETMLDFCHVALWCDDLEKSSAVFAEKTGYQPLEGGRHERPGTWNKLCGAGKGAYVELIAADPDNQLDDVMRRLVEGCADLSPSIVAFKCGDLAGAAVKARESGVHAEGPFSLSRTGEDGSEVEFEALSLHHAKHRLPVLLDWKDAPHPSEILGDGLNIVEIGARSPDPQDLSTLLQKLRIPLNVQRADRAGFYIRIDGPSGTFES